jgi:hypothetical protein
MAEHIRCETLKLDLRPAFDLLEAYLEGRRDEFMAVLEKYDGAG